MSPDQRGGVAVHTASGLWAPTREDADALATEGTAIFGHDPLFCTQVGPVLGAHLGSGMLVGGIGCKPRET